MSFTKDHSSETGNESSHLLDGVGRRILGGHGLGLESGKKKKKITQPPGPSKPIWWVMMRGLETMVSTSNQAFPVPVDKMDNHPPS